MVHSTSFNSFRKRRGRLSRSDVDPAAPLEAHAVERRRPLRLCFGRAPVSGRFGLQLFSVRFDSY